MVSFVSGPRFRSSFNFIQACTSLWDDVIKQFVSHSSTRVLSCAMTAIRYFMDATSLSNANSTKILELEDELLIQLRDSIAGRDEIGPGESRWM
jgi:cohesin complex subunit SA-1/2